MSAIKREFGARGLPRFGETFRCAAAFSPARFRERLLTSFIHDIADPMIRNSRSIYLPEFDSSGAGCRCDINY